MPSWCQPAISSTRGIVFAQISGGMYGTSSFVIIRWPYVLRRPRYGQDGLSPVCNSSVAGSRPISSHRDRSVAIAAGASGNSTPKLKTSA